MFGLEVRKHSHVYFSLIALDNVLYQYQYQAECQGGNIQSLCLLLNSMASVSKLISALAHRNNPGASHQ